MTSAIIKSHCNKCGGERNHIVLHRENSSWSEVVNGGRNTIAGSDTYYMLKCAGCDEIQLRHQSWFSENGPNEEPRVRLYPPAISRRRPTWLLDLAFVMLAPIAVEELLSEIYSSLQNDSRRSAAMAIRSVIETIMIDKINDQGTLGKNVDAFIAAGFVPPASEKFFREILIEAGNAAMHRAWKPTEAQLNTMMDLTEWLVSSIYIHPEQAATVQGQLPARKK
ncbi:DUF4145 domain-containing protein [Mesorhizobium sp.]|uniref:DUF4145 domain-containing protein n=1 Tax=Mesorhizobium sp. TaxID=1871066 RepID=UPI0025B8CDC7|nr:DUF4145 domain-containing protein [Mesorhizobium sp.]